MNANDAKALSLKNLTGPAIQPILDAIYVKIRQAAEKGETSITNPLWGLRLSMTHLQKEAAYLHLINVDGYTVKHHSDPDPGDPRSSAYTVISW